MADISQITLPDNNVYYIKDATARSAIDNLQYAASPSVAGPATRASAIPFAQVDSTSTATVFTATVPGITSLYDGVSVMLKNGVVTSTTNFTLNINGLGAKPVYSNLAAATRDTTIFNVAYTMLFVYDEDRVSDGCWICYRGYDANTNTIGYQLRTNSTVMNVSDTARYYKLYFTSADNTMWVPASVNSTNNATTARAVNQRPIDPFGRIVYTSANTNYAAGANLAAATIWDQYTLSLGYSFNRTGAALTMTVEAPVYVKCAPQADGSAIMDGDTPIVQALPTTDDGKIYIYLGVAYSATNIELVPHHPVYYYKDGAIRLWTNSAEASVPTKTSELTNDSGFITTETDPTVPAWAKAASKPTYTAAEVGALPDSTTIPSKTSDLTNDSGFITDAGVTKITTTAGAHTAVSNATGAVSFNVPTKTSHLTNDSGYITGYTETDPTVPSWAKAASKPSYTASEVGAAASSHTHGNITNAGDITTTATIANGDRLVINDESASKVTNSSITFGTSTTKYLANNGTWQDTPTVPTKTSDLTNDSGFITDAGVTSFNGSTGAVTYTAPVTSVNGSTGAVTVAVPTKTSDLTNDSGFITGIADFTGADGPGMSGTHGLVPAPDFSDYSPTVRFLSARGTWSAIPASSITAGTFDAARLPNATTTTKGGVIVGSGLSVSSGTISVPAMTGATSSAAGAAGLVPAPAAGDDTKFLRGDGTWQTASGGTSGVTSFNGETGAVTLNARNGGGNYSIEEGDSYANGDYSHAEGYSCLTTEAYAHAEGQDTRAYGIAAHAEGNGTYAMSDYSHAEGNNTYAVGQSCHVFGEYNAYEDPSQIASSSRGTYVEVVGNGTPTGALSNARTLDWNGNEVLAGSVTASNFIGNGAAFAFSFDINSTDWTVYSSSYYSVSVYTTTISVTGMKAGATLFVDYQHSDNLRVFETGDDWYTCYDGYVIIYADHVPSEADPMHITGIGVNCAISTTQGTKLYRPPINIIKIWQNSSPTSSFAAQTISYSGSYDAFIVIGLEFSDSERCTSEFVFKGTPGALHCWASTSNNRNGKRGVHVTDSTLVFDACQYNGTTQNSYCIPQRIYGIKGVLGI